MDTTSPPASASGRSIGLRNWRVRSKLIAVLVIPAVAFLVLASFGIGSLIGNAQAFEDGRKLAELGRQVTALVHELQTERDLSVAFTASADKGVGNALSQQQLRVNQAVAAYREAEAPLYEDLGEGVQGRFDAVREGLADLALLRQSTRASSLTGRATSAEYSQIIDQLIDVNAEIAEPGGDEDLAQSVRAFNDLSRAKEVTSQIRGILYALSFRDDFAFGGFQEFSSLLARQQAAFNEFQGDANDAQRALFADVVQGQAVLQVDQIQQNTIRTQSGENINGPQWLAASTTNLELLRSVESQLLDGVIVQSGELSATAQRDALRNALIIAAILGVALLALLLVARSMAQPLQQLRARAIEIAHNRLPDAVQRLRTTETGDLDVRVEPIGIDSRDEIGQVAQAVDDIQEVAVRLATEQAALRRSIGDMFTNLARRSQTLIDRQLELIDDLERNETDPDTLGALFRLDHLATRMRRNAEDLIVLSGADPGRHWVQQMTVVDVVRAAAAEVEEYQRVELLPPGRPGGGRARRRGRHPPAGRADRERHRLLAAQHQGPDRRPGGAARVCDRGRGPRPRDERRGAYPGQRAAGQPARDRLRPVAGAGPVRGRAARPAPRHQGPAAALLVRRGDGADPAAEQPAHLAPGAAGRGGRPGGRGRPGDRPGARRAAAARARRQRGGGRGRAGPLR